MENWTTDGDDILWHVTPKECSLALTLDCGQCFRFEAIREYTFEGIVHGRVLTLVQEPDAIRFVHVTPDEFVSVFAPYFDIHADYAELKRQFCNDATLQKAIACTDGIRVLKQDGFETLISFLISQNNNIPRIKKCIRLLCERYGTELAPGKFSFPNAKTLASCTVEDLAGLSLGYRDRYLIDAAKRVVSGELDLSVLETLPIDEARNTVRTVMGVGPKVAECVLLFGFGRHECFPMDTWMKKVMKAYYPNGLPKEYAGKAGIAQQYLFHYARCFDPSI